MTASFGFGARGWSAVAAFAVVISLAACGGSSSPSVAPVKPSPRKVVLDSVRTTAAAKTARVSFTAGLSGTGDQGFQLGADGVTDFASGNSDLTMHFQGAASSLFPGGIEVRAVDGSSYVKLPASLGGIVGGGKQWLETPTPKLGASSAVPGLDQSDASQYLAYLEAVSSGVKEVGTATIRGIETTHYHATIDLGKAIDRPDVPADLRDKLRQLLESADGSSPAIPADVWIDADGYTRRVSMRIDVGALAGGAAGATAVSVTLDFYDFGVPVNVQAPPADQITQLKGLGLNGGGSFGASGASGASGTAS